MRRSRLAILVLGLALWTQAGADTLPLDDFRSLRNGFVYSFSGDGIVSGDEWNAGSLFATVGGLSEPNLLLEFDVTSILQQVVNAGVGWASHA